jgi:hypothetical protein
VTSVVVMGQPVAVVEKPSSTPGMIRFEANRNLTGMGHERFRSVTDAVGVTPSAELARRLFATGRVDSLHVFGNFITIDLAKGYSSDGLSDVVRDLYQYWRPGMVPAVFEEAVEESADGAAPVAVGGGADAALSEAAKRVPAHLLERSRLAREKWKAEHGG